MILVLGTGYFWFQKLSTYGNRLFASQVKQAIAITYDSGQLTRIVNQAIDRQISSLTIRLLFQDLHFLHLIHDRVLESSHWFPINI